MKHNRILVLTIFRNISTMAFSHLPIIRKYAKTFKKMISELGGSNIKLEGGKVLTMLAAFLGWKSAKQF